MAKPHVKRKPFLRQDRIRMLRWCDRHCCLCDKACGVDIEIAHIDDRSDNRFDNGIPVCYDCHVKMGSYNDLHPRGNKLTPEEIKARREQIYDKHTRSYLAPIQYMIHQDGPWKYPDVGFTVENLSDYLATQLRISVQGLLNKEKVDLRLADPLYRGRKIWNVNPRRQINGHFLLRQQCVRTLGAPDRFELRVSIVQTDAVGRDHPWLEDGYVFKPSHGTWYFEP